MYVLIFFPQRYKFLFVAVVYNMDTASVNWKGVQYSPVRNVSSLCLFSDNWQCHWLDTTPATPTNDNNMAVSRGRSSHSSPTLSENIQPRFSAYLVKYVQLFTISLLFNFYQRVVCLDDYIGGRSLSFSVNLKGNWWSLELFHWALLHLHLHLHLAHPRCKNLWHSPVT